MEESPILHTLESLDANTIFLRKAQDLASLIRNMMNGSYLVTLLQAKHIEYEI